MVKKLTAPTEFFTKFCFTGNIQLKIFYLNLFHVKRKTPKKVYCVDKIIKLLWINKNYYHHQRLNLLIKIFNMYKLKAKNTVKLVKITITQTQTVDIYFIDA